MHFETLQINNIKYLRREKMLNTKLFSNSPTGRTVFMLLLILCILALDLHCTVSDQVNDVIYEKKDNITYATWPIVQETYITTYQCYMACTSHENCLFVNLASGDENEFHCSLLSYYCGGSSSEIFEMIEASETWVKLPQVPFPCLGE